MSSTLITKDAIHFSNGIEQNNVLPRPGTVVMWPGINPPTNALLCQGTLIAKDDYLDLYAVIGYRYGGEGDYFKVPDFRNKYLFGNSVIANNDSENTGNWEIQQFNHTHIIDFSSITKDITSKSSTVETGNAGNARWYPNDNTMNFNVSTNTSASKIPYIPVYTLCNWIIYY